MPDNASLLFAIDSSSVPKGWTNRSAGGKTLSLSVVGPCEPGQILTEAALSIGSQVHEGAAFFLWKWSMMDFDSQFDDYSDRISCGIVVISSY